MYTYVVNVILSKRVHDFVLYYVVTVYKTFKYNKNEIININDDMKSKSPYQVKFINPLIQILH